MLAGDPRRFRLVRNQDESGVSGTGVVAHGVVFPDGTVAMRWATYHPSTALYGDLADVEAIHGHGGSTVLEFLDHPVGRSA